MKKKTNRKSPSKIIEEGLLGFVNTPVIGHVSARMTDSSEEQLKETENLSLGDSPESEEDNTGEMDLANPDLDGTLQDGYVASLAEYFDITPSEIILQKNGAFKIKEQCYRIEPQSSKNFTLLYESDKWNLAAAIGKDFLFEEIVEEPEESQEEETQEEKENPKNMTDEDLVHEIYDYAVTVKDDDWQYWQSMFKELARRFHVTGF